MGLKIYEGTPTEIARFLREQEQQQEGDILSKIKEWIIMLDAPDFKDTDAELVREEMENWLKENKND